MPLACSSAHFNVDNTHKRTTMEGFFDYLKAKYFVDYADNEIQDLIKAVTNCLVQFQTIFNTNVECGVKINNIVLCGSMSEQTSVWLGRHNYRIWKEDKDDISSADLSVMEEEFCCLEFDFLAVLEPLTHDMVTVDTCPAHAKIKSKMCGDNLTMNQLRNVKSSRTYEDNEDGLESENVFDRPCKIIRDEFHEGIISTAQTILKANVKVQDETGTGICTLRFLDTHADANPLFTWASKKKMTPKRNVVGKIDFLPAFRATHIASFTYIVGKTCTGYMSPAMCSTSDTCDSNCKEQCWRISHNKEEAACIQNTSQHHRDMFRIIKVFCDKAAKHQYLSTNFLDKDFSYSFKVPTSYHIKTILLKHIENCVTGEIDCFHEILLSLKLDTEKGLILNWKNTHHLAVEYYEIYFFFILWTIFRCEKQYADCLLKDSPLEMSPCILKLLIETISTIADRELLHESLERNLINILAFPLWDYTLAAIHLNENVHMNGRCDFELERLARVYSCTNQHIESQHSVSQQKLRKSHSESDLGILVDYFDDKHFDKNWESIFYQLRTNSYPDKSFAREIQEAQKHTEMFVAPTNDILQYDWSEKEFIIETIKEDEFYWYDRLQESFMLFSSFIEPMVAITED